MKDDIILTFGTTRPIIVSKRSGLINPVLMYLMLADGNQHLAIARTILAVHDHKLGHVNDDTRHASLRENDVVVSGLKTVIAIARCNTNTVPALFVAGNFADGYASLLVDDLDREQIVLFLDEVSAMGWQTYETQKQLRTHWGWSVSDV